MRSAHIYSIPVLACFGMCGHPTWAQEPGSESVDDNQHLEEIIVTGITERRVDMVFGIGYSDDIDKAQQILEDIVNSHERVLKEPNAVVKLHELADSSVNFICRPWVKPEDYWDVYWDITREVKRRFDAGGVSIPFPQRDVHLYQETPSSA